MRKLRSKLQIIFQDPYASLNPKMRIGAILDEALVDPRPASRQRRSARGASPNCSRWWACAPSMRAAFRTSSRAASASASASRARSRSSPSSSSPTSRLSALDVSIQSQVINLLADLRERLSLTMLFISHDLDVVEYLCDRVVVLYLGKVMEVAQTDRAVRAAAAPLHPGAAGREPEARPDAAEHARRAEGRHPEPDGAAFGLRVSHPLPARDRRLRRACAAARRGRAGPLVGLHPQGDRTRMTAAA